MKILSTFKKARIISSLLIILILLLLSTCTLRYNNPFLRTSGDNTESKSDPIQILGITNFSLGATHQLLLDETETVWAVGSGIFGKLGDGTQERKTVPVKIMDDAKDICAGGFHTLILKNDNTLWATGWNLYGALGVGDKVTTHDVDSYSTTPLEVTSDVKSMAAGVMHSLILKTDGTLWAVGLNEDGQLGVGDKVPSGDLQGGYGANMTDFINTPIEVTNDVKSMSAGSNYTLVLKNDDTLWAAGENYSGQLATGDKINRTSLIKIADSVKNMNAGLRHTLILKTDNTLWAAGWNHCGQLGVGDKVPSGQLSDASTTFVEVTSDVKSMNAGDSYTLVLKNDDTLWAAGENHRGNFGIGTVDSQYTANPILIKINTNVKKMYAGIGVSTLVLKNDDTLWVAGNNQDGQLGLGDLEDRHTFTQITISE